MFDILGLLNDIANSVAHEVGSAITNVISNIQNDYNKYVVRPISTDVTNAMLGIGHALNQLEVQASNGVNHAINTMSQTLTSVESSVVVGFDRGMSAIESAMATMASDVATGLNDVVSGIERGFSTIESGLKFVSQSIATALENSIKILSGKIVEGVNAVIKPLTLFIEALPKDIETIAQGVKSELEKVATGVEDFAQEQKRNFDAGEKRLATQMGKIKSLKDIEGSSFDLAPSMEKLVTDIIGIDIDKIDKGSFTRLIAGLGIEIGIGLLANDLTGLEYMLAQQMPQLINIALRGSWRDLEQAANAGNPNMLIGIGEAIAGKYKGYVTDKYFYDQAARSGFSKENADYMFKIADTLLGLGELISLYFRGKIVSKEELYAQAYQVRASKYQVDQTINLFEKLFGAGESVEFWRRGILPVGFKGYFDDLEKVHYTPERIDAIKLASYKLPSWKEQKEFGYRGMYDPATIEKYQYDYKLDDKYLANAKANGYDEATAKRLYQSSWEVAPFFITEGLYRSGKIAAGTFKQLLLLDGYSPAWADIFIKELQPTLATGDIKDLYKYQVITADQIVEQLVSIGLATPIAEQYKKLWIASIKLASPIDQTATQVEAGKIKGNTEGLIKTAYKDKILSKDQAIKDLKAINVSDEAAALTIDIIDYEIEQQHIKDTYVLLEDELKARAITLADALTKLQATGATADQMVLFNRKLQEATHIKTKIPTLSEFKSWYKKGIINATMLLESMRFLGYADTWIPFFLIEAGVPRKEISTLMTTPINPLTP